MTISALTPDPGWMGDRRRGAGMGRPSRRNPDAPAAQRFYLQRMRLDSGGYDAGGAYWGLGAPLFRYQSEDGENTGHLRARHRAAAKTAVLQDFPQARFFR